LGGASNETIIWTVGLPSNSGYFHTWLHRNHESNAVSLLLEYNNEEQTSYVKALWAPEKGTMEIDKDPVLSYPSNDAQVIAVHWKGPDSVTVFTREATTQPSANTSTWSKSKCGQFSQFLTNLLRPNSDCIHHQRSDLCRCWNDYFQR